MSEITYHFQLSNQQNKRGFYQIMLRITQNRVSKRIKTGIEVLKKDWNPVKENIRKSTIDYAKNNTLLADIKKTYSKAEVELAKEGKATIENIIAKVKGDKTSESFLEYAKEQTQLIYESGSISNWKTYNGFCNKLENYLYALRKRDLLFVEVTSIFVKKFDAYLHSLPNERYPERKLHQNTIWGVHKAFRSLVNKAIKDELMKVDNSPYGKHKFVPSKLPVEKDALSNDDIDKIKALELQEGSLIWHCRNYFLFSYYCAGIRIGDLIQLRWCNITPEGKVKYVMAKTHNIRSVTMRKSAKEILKHYRRDSNKPSDYIFPLLDNNAMWAKYVTQADKDVMHPDLKKTLHNTIGAKVALINKYLKKMQEMAEITTKITCHISRHSFARKAIKKGASHRDIQMLLGHSRLQTTEIYLGNADSEVEEQAMQFIFDDEEDELLVDGVEVEDQETALLNQLKGIDPQILAKVLDRLNKE